MRRAASWIPILTLVGLAIAFLGRRTFAPPREELVIEPSSVEKIPPLVLPAGTAAVSGRVLDPDEHGVEGALVWLRAGDEPHWTYTAADGNFRLDDLEPGPWSASVVAAGFAPEKLELVESAAPASIHLGRPFGEPPQLPPIARAPLEGTVRSRLPGTFEGCEIVLVPTLPPHSFAAPLPRRADVAADGSFEIEALVLGEYRVEVRPAWARGGSWPDLASALAEGDGQAAPRLFVHEARPPTGKPKVLDVELATGDVVGKLVDLDFETVEGALLLLARATDPSRVWPTAESGPDGSFAFRGVPAGRYSLTARAGSATLVQDVAVVAGETTTLQVAPLEVRRAR